VRLYKILAIVLLFALLIGSGIVFYIHRLGQPVALMLDGQPIVNVRNAATADEILRQAELAKVGSPYSTSSIVRLQKVQMEHIAAGATLVPNEIAVNRLASRLRVNVRAYAILVNGHVSIGLPTDEMAADTLHQVKEHFAQMPPDAEIVAEPTFTQRVTIAQRSIGSALARPSSAAAAPYFWTPPPSKTYIVRRGDTGLAIARRNHISLTDFIVANAGTNINKLMPGEAVNVEKKPLLLTVQVQKRMRRDEKVLPGVSGPGAGLQRVTYIVTYTNGQETHRDPVSIQTMIAPRPRTSL
jgi:LysM repeat protein